MFVSVPVAFTSTASRASIVEPAARSTVEAEFCTETATEKAVLFGLVGLTPWFK